MPKKSSHRQSAFYKSLPKVELHRHLEGSLRLSTMIATAKEFSLDLPYDDVDKLRALVQIQNGDPFTHKNFLSKFQTLRLFYQSPDVIRRIAREVVADAAADNIRYLEIRFTPVALTRIRDFPIAEAIDWVIDSVEGAAEEYGVKTRLIASVNRHESVELAEEVIRLAIDRKDNGIAAIDLAGDEANSPGSPFAGIFKEAKDSGMGVTIHAGEWGAAANITEAIEELGAGRIGHGVKVLEDERSLELAKQKRITFEVCVTSNYHSGITPSLAEHPLPHMLSAGLDVTVNTDDPGLSQIDLSDEYEVACEDLGLSLDTLKETVLDAARAAFLPEDERVSLVKSLEVEFKDNGD